MLALTYKVLNIYVMKPVEEVFINGTRYVPEKPVIADNIYEKALDHRFEEGDYKNRTTRELFTDLLVRLVYEGDYFSAKRPWGNSGWEWHLRSSLAKAGFIAFEKNVYIDPNDPDDPNPDFDCEFPGDLNEASWKFIDNMIRYMVQPNCKEV